jgi:hypothetical protein
MRRAGSSPFCAGIRRQTLVQDTTAIEQKDEAEEGQFASNDFYFGCMGITQTTPKMDGDGSIPHCKAGMRIAVIASPKDEKGGATNSNSAEGAKQQNSLAIPDQKTDEAEPYSVGAGFRHSWGKQ